MPPIPEPPNPRTPDGRLLDDRLLGARSLVDRLLEDRLLDARLLDDRLLGERSLDEPRPPEERAELELDDPRLEDGRTAPVPPDERPLDERLRDEPPDIPLGRLEEPDPLERDERLCDCRDSEARCCICLSIISLSRLRKSSEEFPPDRPGPILLGPRFEDPPNDPGPPRPDREGGFERLRESLFRPEPLRCSIILRKVSIRSDIICRRLSESSRSPGRDPRLDGPELRLC